MNDANHTSHDADTTSRWLEIYKAALKFKDGDINRALLHVCKLMEKVEIERDTKSEQLKTALKELAIAGGPSQTVE